MAYNINLTNGTSLTTLADGSADTTTTSLTLLGKNFTGYGKLLNENFVHLLENFASNTAPSNPLIGQLWYDKSDDNLKLRSSSDTWKSLSGSATSSATTPLNPNPGNLWFKNTTKQLYVYGDSGWELIGPYDSTEVGISGAIPDIIKDTNNIDHVVIKFYINNIITAIWTKENSQFTVNENNKVDYFSDPGQPQILKPGLTLANFGTVTLPSYGNVNKNTIWGTSENALKLNNVLGSNYVRKDVAAGLQEIKSQVTINQTLTVDGILYTGRNIIPLDNDITSIGSSNFKFKEIFVGNVRANNIIGNIVSSSTDNLPEGSINRYFTVARQEEVQNYTNLTNKPILVSNIFVDANNKVKFTRTDNTTYEVLSMVGNVGNVGYVGSQGNVGYVGSKGDVGYTGSAGPVTTIDYSTLDRFSVGAYAFLATDLQEVPRAGNLVTGYTYASHMVTSQHSVFVNDSSVFQQNSNLLLGTGRVGNVTSLTTALKHYYYGWTKTSTVAPGTWKIINSSVGYTYTSTTPDQEYPNSGIEYYSFLTSGAGWYTICFAVRVA